MRKMTQETGGRMIELGNKISGATGDAIDVCTNGNVLTSNTIFNSGRSSVHFDASCGALFGGSTGNNNTATKNTILETRMRRHSRRRKHS